MTVVQVLVDADNLTSARLRLLVEALATLDGPDSAEVRMVVAGAQGAVANSNRMRLIRSSPSR